MPRIKRASPLSVRPIWIRAANLTDLLQWDESGGVSGTNTGSTVLDGLIRDGELAQIVSDHLGLDFHLIEGLAIVDAHDGSGHLGDDDHVSQVGLDHVGLLIGLAFLLLLAELLDEGHGLALQTPAELAANAAREQLHQLLVVHVQELVQVHATVRELAEGPLLLHFLSLERTQEWAW